jgi:hypothetical protein
MAAQVYQRRDPNVVTLAHWLARKAYKEELRAMGRRPEYEEIGEAANVYFVEHRNELIAEEIIQRLGGKVSVRFIGNYEHSLTRRSGNRRQIRR